MTAPTRRPRGARALVAATLGLAALACAGSAPDCGPPFLAVLSAFPAELAPFLEHAEIEETVTIDGRPFRRGRLAGVPVVLGLTGIGMKPASTTTRAVLERFPVQGVVVSGVAGSRNRIGDVMVPASWTDEDGTTRSVHGAWLELASQIAASGEVALERCTLVPDEESKPEVCLEHQPVILVGGAGRSRDPRGMAPFPCQPEGGDVFGCDVRAKGSTPAWMKGGVPDSAQAQAGGSGDEPELEAPGGPVVGDMETAAVAREAAARGVPLIAFRAASDGKGDPLKLTRPFAQFFVFYRLAGRNAAASTQAFLARLAANHACGA
jgi:nucleoside phosphorylase